MPTQNERLYYLIQYLLSESPKYKGIEIPESYEERQNLFRALVNVRPPKTASGEFLRIQDEYLSEELQATGITDVNTLKPVAPGIYIWQGDITTLKTDAIVNAANSAMLGCWQPCHACIDNCIHTFAGVQLRLACSEIMQAQGHEEPTGCAKLTPAFNLPCKYVIHTVGPIVSGPLTETHKQLLASSYRSCLKLASENGCESIAFCCISTGVFRFPNECAAEIAVSEVKNFLTSDTVIKKVVFNVFKDLDREIYNRLLKS